MLRMLETANEESIPFRREELGMEPKVFVDIAKRCGFEVMTHGSGNKTRVKLKKRGIPVTMLYGSDVSREFSFLDLADIHAGHQDFSPEILDDILAMYYNNGNPLVDYVFIAGDLVEGIVTDEYCYELVTQSPKIRKHVCDIQSYQVRMLYNVFSKYDFDYRVINGNHEYTFEQLGVDSPLAKLEHMMRQNGMRFTYYDTYIMDFVIAGVVKRMMHLESYHQRDGAIHAYDRLNKFERHGGLSRYYGSEKLPIRFFQCGHIHRRAELYDSRNKVYISQSGSFIKHEMLYSPAIHMKGIVLDDSRILRD